MSKAKEPRSRGREREMVKQETWDKMNRSWDGAPDACTAWKVAPKL